MSVNPKYYYNLSGNITDGKKEYSLYHKEDKIGGLSISSGLKDNYIEYGTNSLLDLLNELAEENKTLKTRFKEVLKLLEEEVDLFSDKATEHDIQAYIELRELDNKDAYYMATATKKVIKLLKGVVDD